MHKTQLFVSGIPGCGKSTFGRWLAQEKQFTYVDMEHDDLDKYGFRSSWNTFADGTDGGSFVSAIQTHPSSVVLDWGFPPVCADSPLKTTLKAEINAEAWATLNNDTSRPFDKTEEQLHCYEVINHLGDEVMKVFRV
jgi:hypothetical protein